MTETLNPVKTYRQFIGGEFVDYASGETLEVENPATYSVVAKVPASGKEDVDRAVAAGAIRMQPETLALIRAGSAKKGDALGVARPVPLHGPLQILLEAHGSRVAAKR